VRVLGATSYEVFRGASDTGAFSLVGTVTANSIFDTGLTCGAFYYYKVSALNRFGNKGQSVAVGSTTGLPEDVAARLDSLSEMVVTWMPVPGAALYNAYRSTSDTGVFSKVASITGDTLVDTGLSAGLTYYYKIGAANNSQESPLTLPVIAKTIPAAPANVTIVSVLGNVDTIAWQPSVGAVLYRVYRSASDTGAYTLVDSSSSDTASDFEVPSGVRSYYFVTAVNSVGKSKKSAPASVFTVPASPQIVFDSAVSSTSIMVVWNRDSGATSYNVYRKDTTVDSFSLAANVTSDTLLDTGLATGIIYHYVVSALDSAGESPKSAVDSATTSASGTQAKMSSPRRLRFGLKGL
jgi:fibronectin type 3 domain-containing protein